MKTRKVKSGHYEFFTEDGRFGEIIKYPNCWWYIVSSDDDCELESGCERTMKQVINEIMK